MKIYANDIYYVITNRNLVEEFKEIIKIKMINYGEFVLKHKEFSNRLRDILKTDNMLTMIMKYNELHVYEMNVKATSFNHYRGGIDENGVYTIIDGE